MTRTLDGILLDIAIARMRLAVGISTRDRDWDEDDHPRDEIGRFSLGAGSAGDYQRVSEAHTKAAGEHRAASMFLDPESAGAASHRTAADLHDTAATHYLAGSADPTSTVRSLAATSSAVAASHAARAADPSRRRVHTPPVQEGAAEPADTSPVIPEVMRPGEGTAKDWLRVAAAHENARKVHENLGNSTPMSNGPARFAHFTAAGLHRNARITAQKVIKVPGYAHLSASSTAAALEGSRLTDAPDAYSMSVKATAPKKAESAKFNLPDQPARSRTELAGLSVEDFRDAYGIHVEHQGDEAKHSFYDKNAYNDVRRQVAALPKSHREQLGGRVSVAVVDKITINGISTTGITGTGSAAGVFRGNGRLGGTDLGGTVEIAKVYGVGSEHRTMTEHLKVTAHEIGHALDQSLGKPSSSAAFIASIPARGERGTTNQEGSSYYYHLTNGETWAESYAAEYGTDYGHVYFGGMDKATAQKVYAKPIAAIKKILASKGL